MSCSIRSSLCPWTECAGFSRWIQRLCGAGNTRCCAPNQVWINQNLGRTWQNQTVWLTYWLLNFLNSIADAFNETAWFGCSFWFPSGTSCTVPGFYGLGLCFAFCLFVCFPRRITYIATLSFFLFKRLTCLLAQHFYQHHRYNMQSWNSQHVLRSSSLAPIFFPAAHHLQENGKKLH